jgi:hypothetical protein
MNQPPEPGTLPLSRDFHCENCDTILMLPAHRHRERENGQWEKAVIGYCPGPCASQQFATPE